MLFSSRISLSNMVSLCQAFRVGHAAGLPIAHLFEKQAQRGPIATRPVISRIAERLKQGDSLEDVLQTDGASFPPLFTTMVTVGEQTGNLPEIFRELERYYREQLTLKRQFLQQIAWPVFEMVIAIAAITLMIIFLGIISEGNGVKFDPLGFGLGIPGALRFLGCVAMFLGAIFATYVIATKVLGKTAVIHRYLLSIPGVGPCIEAIVLTRVCLALKLTLDSSLSTHKAIKRSLMSSGNGAYEACADPIAAEVKKGEEVTEAMTNCRIFPEQFLQAVHAGEESGQLPEVMGKQSEYYQEVASFRLKILNRIASFGVWAFIAIILIIGIMKIANSIYGGGGILDRAGSMDLSKPLVD